MSELRRRLIRSAPPQPPDAVTLRRVQRLRVRLGRELIALQRWQVRLKRAFNTVDRTQQRITRLERKLAHLEKSP